MTKYNLAPANYHGKPLLDVGGDEIEVHIFPDLQAQRRSLNGRATGQSSYIFDCIDTDTEAAIRFNRRIRVFAVLAVFRCG